MSAEQIMAAARPGSGDWDWLEEARQMMTAPHIANLRSLLRLFASGDWRCTTDYRNGGAWIVVGNDGRLWDGHHRVIAAWLIDPERPLRVRKWPPEATA